MEWISVKDRLPLVTGFYICHKTTPPNVIGLYFDSDKRFRYDKQDHTKNIIHWMPLPTPPTENK